MKNNRKSGMGGSPHSQLKALSIMPKVCWGAWGAIHRNSEWRKRRNKVEFGLGLGNIQMFAFLFLVEAFR